ncbi:LtfC-like domain-containing protein [Tsukamurella paurometabola]|uniref:LtfC/p132/Gp6 beta-sandwich domain-containing protein n=1 Tax=Tsukamurella paurometabola TaxID=2061 RepID=A0ABS5NG85_TSUPA|nr:hypothetical protein [Tsukamurella paurometabola]MBS4103281.1 hypothetical protein [Tsukamurella paurometabola]
MGAKTLGFEPNYHVMILSAEAGFVTNVSVKNEFWPAEATCWIKFPTLSLTWDATVEVDSVGSRASFVKEPADIAAIPDGVKYRMYLDYGDGTPPYLWYRGVVSRQE